MTGDEKPTRKGLRQAAKGIPGGTGRKRTPLPEDIEETLAGMVYDREIKIVEPTWPARDRDAEIEFTSGNMTNSQGVTEADMQRLADVLAERGIWARAPELPATVTPMVITDDIALNMAATVLDVMGQWVLALDLRKLLPRAEGKIHGQPYQEQTGKWGEPDG